ncbi:hypothetical protein GW17_00036051 [Ensete ventricosum]|nr:hypothetical protein GW17_00036051 [Ensete ventricosum]
MFRCEEKFKPPFGTSPPVEPESGAGNRVTALYLPVPLPLFHPKPNPLPPPPIDLRSFSSSSSSSSTTAAPSASGLREAAAEPLPPPNSLPLLIVFAGLLSAWAFFRALPADFRERWRGLRESSKGAEAKNLEFRCTLFGPSLRRRIAAAHEERDNEQDEREVGYSP